MVKFSVIIPTYNRADLIRRCIDSVLNQSYQNFEIIVVDNYSEDATIDIVKSYADSRIKIFQIHNHGIIAASRNKGIVEASGEWICFLDSDDWWKENKLLECEKMVEISDVIYHKMYVASSKGKRFFPIGRRCSLDVFSQILLTGNMICNSSLCCKKEALISIGLLSENPKLVGVEDCDCWLRLSKEKFRFRFIPKTLGFYWIGNNISVSLSQLKKESILMYRYIDDLPLNKLRIAKKNLCYRKARIYHKLGKYRSAFMFYKAAIGMNCNHLFKIYFFMIETYLKMKI